MRDVSRELHTRRQEQSHSRQGAGGGLGGSRVQPGRRGAADDTSRYSVQPVRKPRAWRFQTKPFCRRIRQPLIDVFHEALEVLIVIDLCGFEKGEVVLNMTPEKYTIEAKRGNQEFKEVIELPPEVDIDRSVENFRNGILEIILPRKDNNAPAGEQPKADMTQSDTKEQREETPTSQRKHKGKT